jgi:hypothetical protein
MQITHSSLPPLPKLFTVYATNEKFKKYIILK